MSDLFDTPPSSLTEPAVEASAAPAMSTSADEGQLSGAAPLSDRATRFAEMDEEQRRRLKAAEPGGGGGPNSKYFGGRKDFALFGENLFGDAITQDVSGKLRERFDFPPFTVLNAREGQWQERKRAWLSMGIQSEVGRGENLLKMSDTLLEPDPEKRAVMQKARAFGQDFNLGAQPTHGDEGKSWKGQQTASLKGGLTVGTTIHPYDGQNGGEASASGTSIFDPVLTELSYRWFCPPGGQIVDPFAGGSVRGIVAGCLGFKYHGIDLRPEQIAANEAQRELIAPHAEIHWACGDSNVLLKEAPDADLIFSCPPYGDLEQYSDDPNDLSAMTWEGFVGLYRAIIRKSVERLKPNRFAIFVVGEYRDKKTGLYRGFVPLTCASFMAVGAALYNEAILVTSVGSLPIRTQKQFESTRKLGKTHQNILIFCKGDPRLAAEACAGKAEAAPSAPRPAKAPSPKPAAGAPAPAESGPRPANDGGSLATFLGESLRPAAPSNWRPDEIPDLQAHGVREIILNFATNGLAWAKGDRPVGVTVSTLDGQLTRFLPFAFQGGGNLDEGAVKRFVESLRGMKVYGGNTRFDMHMSREWGVDLDDHENTFTDIMHTAALLDDSRRRFALDVLAADWLKDNEATARVDESQHANYHAGEVAEREYYTARLVGRLREVMYPELEKQDLIKVQALEDECIPAVVEMEKNGSPLNLELLEEYHVEALRRHDALIMEVTKEVGFAFDHTATGWQRLFEALGLPPTDGNAEAIINRIDHPIVRKAQLASQYASLDSKTFKAYKENVGRDGILRFDINQLRGEEGGTITGRFSIGYVQQVPNHDNHFAVFGDELFPRRLFIPALFVRDDGSDTEYLEADAMQIEQRLLVNYAGNERIIKEYEGDLERLQRGEEPISYHKVTWKMMKEYKPDMLYSHQKNFNFAFQYGAKSIKLAVMMGFISEEEGDEIRGAQRWDDPRLSVIKEIEAAYKRMMPEGNALLDRASHLAKSKCDKFCKINDAMHAKYKHQGFVKTLVGRRRRFPDNYNTYRGLNCVLQGSGADIMKKKLAELHRARKHTGLLMRMTVHDAVGGDARARETRARVSEVLNHQSFPLRVPILWSVKTGSNWAECK